MSTPLPQKPVLKPPRRPSTQPWQLRPALPADAASLHANCLPDQPLDQVKKLLRRSQKAALNRRGLGLVADLGGEVIGFGQMTLWPTTAEIGDVVVGAPWRRRGIGSALVLRLVEAAREMAAERVEIGVALRDYEVLLLYRKLGFAYGRTLDLDLGRGPEPVMYLTMNLARE